MSKKYVYLAGPIEGCNDDEINEWRDYSKYHGKHNAIISNTFLQKNRDWFLA